MAICTWKSFFHQIHLPKGSRLVNGPLQVEITFRNILSTGKPVLVLFFIQTWDILSTWIEDCNQKRIPLNKMTMKMKDARLFAAID